MSILESAIKLSEVVEHIAKEKGVSKEDAWIEAVVLYKEKYETIKIHNY
ncbi:MAG: hypothetical protein ACRCXA_02630 [Peptostreptococcaceae bacterium]